ncbi:hypothetical protein K3H45_16615 [Aeromonas veronii]|uniref:hypothetical protein n=1 Tax=Aeromonas veronii TaxID=654 RepID=UPI001F32BCFC|nr:hypothetical protein [Aeromonas veronii]MCF5761497.1 hypothetical protein [Aeromonas veronii]
MEEAIFGFMGAITGALLGFLGSILSAFGKNKDTQLTVLTQSVSSERAKWRSDMRILSSDLVSLLYQLKNTNDDKLQVEFQKTRVQLRLRLNPNDGHIYDKELLENLNDFNSFVTSNQKSSFAFSDKIETFEANMQLLIKQEWDKSKTEVETGNLGKSDKSI